MMNLESSVQAFVREGFAHQFGKPAITVKDDPEWRKVRDAGTRLWLDTGDIDEAAKLWNSSFDALTTNNTLLNKEIQKGIYDDLVAKAARVVLDAAPKISQQDLILEIAFILNAHHALRLVDKFDAYVSVELHTDLSGDVERTVAYGKRYYAICPERFIVKVPLTPAGYLGARKLAAAGIPLNFTLGFSARHNYVAALLTKPNYVNVFLGRLNAVVVDNKLGDGRNVGEKATLATQRELLALRKAGRTKTNLIAASIRSGEQIGALAGVDVHTMPTKAAAEYRAKPLPKVTSQVANDPSVPLAPGVAFAQFGGETLWDVPQKFKDAVDSLLRQNLDALKPDDVQSHFEKAGFADFLPRWSAADIQTATKDGKIPVYATWKDRLASGKVGLDALMNLSALYSFATDQKALDDRIRSLLKKANILT
ncbi:MAG TPA: transaldolase family protein [Verrucomicrobiae bacterium]|nr:transaldolase family protein [Verrucomicrobiae bacterium]